MPWPKIWWKEDIIVEASLDRWQPQTKPPPDSHLLSSFGIWGKKDKQPWIDWERSDVTEFSLHWLVCRESLKKDIKFGYKKNKVTYIAYLRFLVWKYHTQNKVLKTLCAQQIKPGSFPLQAGKFGSQFNEPGFCLYQIPYRSSICCPLRILRFSTMYVLCYGGHENVFSELPLAGSEINIRLMVITEHCFYQVLLSWGLWPLLLGKASSLAAYRGLGAYFWWESWAHTISQLYHNQ